MVNFNEYPYRNLTDLNLDYLEKKMNVLKEIMDTFVTLNTVTFADPIIWNITTQYARNTVVLDTAGNAYLSKEAVPAGVQLNNSNFWLEIFNFTEYTRTANKNLTVNVETNTTRATHHYNVDDWLIWNDVLYKVTSAIAVDDTLMIGTNIVHFTVEDFIKAFMTWATNTIQQYKNDIDASELLYRQQLAGDIANTTASLQAQLDAAIAGVTVDSEVINARIGADGVTYTTLGDAIRTQLTNVYATIDKMTFIDGFTWIKELYLNEASATAGVYKLHSMRVISGTFYFRFRDSANNTVASTPVLPVSTRAFTIVPIYGVSGGGTPDTTKLYGYMLVNGGQITADATFTNALIKDIAFNIEYSPAIKSMLTANNIGNPEIVLVSQPSDFVNVSESIKHGGDTGHYTDYNTTDYIPCKAGDVLEFRLEGYYRISVELKVDTIAFFDSERNYIDGIYYTSGTTGGGIIYEDSVTVPDGACYFKALYYGAIVTDPYVHLKASGMFAKRNNNVKIAFIGDSLTQGVNGTGPVTYCDRPMPVVFRNALISRGFDVTIKNFGRHGLSPQTYLDEAIPNDSQYHNHVDGNPGDDIELNSSFDVVFIMLGTNGHLEDGGYHQEQQIAAYKNIIKWVMSETDNHAQIILIAPPYANAENYEQKLIGTLPTIQTIGREYQLPVINALYDSGLGKYNTSDFYIADGVHFNQAGYSKLGTFIASQFVSLYSTFNMNEIPI